MKLPLSAGRMFAGIFSCAQPHAPPVIMRFYDKMPQVEAAQSQAHMIAMRKKAVSPYYGGEFPNVEGVTSGTFNIKYDLNFTAIEQTMLHTACVRTKNAHITITYKPVIYMSNKLAPNSCMYKETMAHEMRHVGTDITTINAFLPKIRAAAIAALVPQHAPRPVPQSQIKIFQADETKKLSEAVGKITAALQRTRKIRQMHIDTQKEYERLSHACPGRKR